MYGVVVMSPVGSNTERPDSSLAVVGLSPPLYRLRAVLINH